MRKFNHFIFGALAALLMALPTWASAADLTDVNEIVRQANNVSYYAGNDGRSQSRMTITDKQGRTQIRQFTILRRDRADGGDQDYLVLFSRPADVRRTVFLVAKHVKGDDDRWLYLPGLDLVKRISAGDKRTSFVGSHIFYEDVSGRRTDEDTHELVETTDEHYVLLNKPKDPGSVEFAGYKIWIEKKSLLPVKMEFSDDKGEVYRRMTSSEIQDIQGHPTATKMLVEDLRSGGNTVIEFRNIEYDLGIPEDIFSERSLRNPPLDWFRAGK